MKVRKCEMAESTRGVPSSAGVRARVSRCIEEREVYRSHESKRSEKDRGRMYEESGDATYMFPTRL